ncbi:MAG: ABC transporter ATP-binding protein [Opitutaceae bacterium]
MAAESSSKQFRLRSDFSNTELLRRLLAFAWRYRKSCLTVLGVQLVLLAIGLGGLGLTGFGLDVIRAEVEPGQAAPRWPFGWEPPTSWPVMQKIALIAAAILALAGVRAVLNYAYGVLAARLIHVEMVYDLRNQVYQKLHRLSFRFFDANASGSIINRVTGDVQALRSFVDGVLIQTVIMALSLGVYLTYMLNIHVPLTLACLAATPLLWGASVLFSTRVRPMYVRNRELFDTMVLNLAEAVQGVHTVKGFGREPEIQAKFNNAAQAVRDQQQGIFWRVSIFSPFVGFITQVNLIVLLGYGGWLVARDEIAFGTGLVVFAGLLQQFSGQVSNIATITNTIQQSLTGARRVFEVLDAPVEVATKPDAVKLGRARGAVGFEHVDFAYKSIDPVLRDIDFAVEPGQCVAVVGATGSGKSATLSLLPRFYDVTGGRITLDGHDLRDLDVEELRRNIGIVFQESFLFSNTVAANIAFGHPAASREQIERAARIACAHEFIVSLPKGYDTILGEHGANLSGGQRQRLALARAILLEPPILILDDPTAAIDPETENEILEAMDRAIAGRTTFIVANRMSTLRRADLVVVLDKGRIVQTGTHESLLAQPGLYQRFARLQIVDDDGRNRQAEGRAG